MKISVTSQKTNGLERYMESMLKADFSSDLTKEGQNGLEKLKRATPQDSGKTAGAWSMKVNIGKARQSVTFSNSSSTKTGVPIPILIKNGHGTGTGGYVPPNDFITPIVDDTFKAIGNSIDRKLKQNG